MKHGIVQDQTFWKNLTIQYQVEMKILLKQTEVQRILTLYVLVVCIQVCCCVFIGTDLSMLLCFYRKVFKYAIVFLLERI